VRIADLPWYDLPELRAATDAWWRGIASHLRALGVDQVPDALHREVAHEQNWRDPRLLLSQACGYDVLYDSSDVLQPVATPCYALPGCSGPRYSSVVVVRSDAVVGSLADLRGARCVVNEATSHSGTNALRPLVAELARDGRFFASVAASGSHSDSLEHVRSGKADVACIDTVVLALVRQVRPDHLAGLRELQRTQPALAPPYVTSAQTDTATLRLLQRALFAALRDPQLAACRAALHIIDFALLPAVAYRELAAFETAALQGGYFELPAPQRSPLTAAARAGALVQQARPAAPRGCAEGAGDRMR
jgi:ABC-type phosphate/phosphonate transport system substrate-binding protein